PAGTAARAGTPSVGERALGPRGIGAHARWQLRARVSRLPRAHRTGTPRTVAIEGSTRGTETRQWRWCGVAGRSPRVVPRPRAPDARSLARSHRLRDGRAR